MKKIICVLLLLFVSIGVGYSADVESVEPTEIELLNEEILFLREKLAQETELKEHYQKTNALNETMRLEADALTDQYIDMYVAVQKDNDSLRETIVANTMGFNEVILASEKANAHWEQLLSGYETRLFDAKDIIDTLEAKNELLLNRTNNYFIFAVILSLMLMVTAIIRMISSMIVKTVEVATKKEDLKPEPKPSTKKTQAPPSSATKKKDSKNDNKTPDNKSSKKEDKKTDRPPFKVVKEEGEKPAGDSPKDRKTSRDGFFGKLKYKLEVRRGRLKQERLERALTEKKGDVIETVDRIAMNNTGMLLGKFGDAIATVFNIKKPVPKTETSKEKTPEEEKKNAKPKQKNTKSNKNNKK